MDAPLQVLQDNIQIPAEPCTFWAALKYGGVVHTQNQSYAILVSLAPISQGYITFQMRVLDADILYATYPEVLTEGLMGEWHIDKQCKGEHVRLQFLRPAESPQQFLQDLQTKSIHPFWLWPSYEHLVFETEETICESGDEKCDKNS
jgi:hypothetical protein